MRPGPREKCAVFGVRGAKNASKLAYYGCFAQQHRGEESTRIISSDGTEFFEHGDMGLVSEVFRDFDFDDLPGSMAIGHDRYSTHGTSSYENIQPLYMHCSRGNIAVGHNGTLVNFPELRKRCEENGQGFTTTADTEIVLHGIAKSKEKRIEDAVAEALEPVEGSFALVIMTDKELVAVRDPRGFKPLSIARNGNSFSFASETCAFDLTGSKYMRDVEPGEIVVIDDEGLRSISPFPEKDKRFCIFEYIYFAKPDSYIFGNHCVCTVREAQGRQLAMEHPADADVVIGVPNCAVDHARGYAKESGIEFRKGYAVSFYVGRTFIQPFQVDRTEKVRLKLNVIKDDVRGKNVVVVEDSIVRGTTTETRMKQLREAGAKKIHLRVACPPHRFGCYYGIDFPSQEELAANRFSKGELADVLGVDSLEYLSQDGLLRVMPVSPDIYCISCFDGSFPAGKPTHLASYTKS